ncbi:MAG: cation transporter [Candidatus Nanopelagicaceae bacterium]|nr:cation transporter [Candidatus Nanopelagicaceae bacterium]
MTLRKTVLIVATLNLLYFCIEFYYGRRYHSVSLLGDSIDFLEDASVNILIALAIGWSITRRQKTSYLLAAILLVPGIAFIWNALNQFSNPEVPDGSKMGYVGIGALVVNVSCAFMIAKHRKEQGGLVMAAFYSARNDAMANILIIGAGIFTTFQPSVWPDLIVGIFIFLMNADAAKEIITASRAENKDHRA